MISMSINLPLSPLDLGFRCRFDGSHIQLWLLTFRSADAQTPRARPPLYRAAAACTGEESKQETYVKTFRLQRGLLNTAIETRPLTSNAAVARAVRIGTRNADAQIWSRSVEVEAIVARWARR